MLHRVNSHITQNTSEMLNSCRSKLYANVILSDTTMLFYSFMVFMSYDKEEMQWALLENNWRAAC